MKYARRHTVTQGNGKAWSGPAQSGRSHKGSGFAGTGEQGMMVCPGCGILLKTVKAYFTDTEAGIHQGKTVMIGNHRPGGGRARKDEYPCKGSMTAVQSLNE